MEINQSLLLYILVLIQPEDWTEFHETNSMVAEIKDQYFILCNIQESIEIFGRNPIYSALQLSTVNCINLSKTSSLNFQLCCSTEQSYLLFMSSTISLPLVCHIESCNFVCQLVPSQLCGWKISKIMVPVTLHLF